MSAVKNLAVFVKKLEILLGVSVSKNQMEKLGEQASFLIVKRTRLGYGVKNKTKKKLSSMRKWKKSYRLFRKTYPNLLNKKVTAPTKQNLTFSGQMLDSYGVSVTKNNSVLLSPRGYRKDAQANVKIGNIVSKKGWLFSDLTSSEELQLTRWYRKEFGDLVKAKLT